MQFQFEREYQIQINQKKLAVIEWGAADAEPVLCMHGWLDNAATFHYLAPFLKDNYRLIALELPGHGQSEHLSMDADYQFVAGLSHIDKALDNLQIENCKVIGHSMGAALSLLYAGVMPQRISQLVSIDALGAFTSSPEETSTQLKQAIEQRKKISANKRFFESVESAAQARAQVSELSAEILYPLVERGVMMTEQGYQWSSDARLKNASWLRMSEAQHEAVLGQVKAEVLLLEATEGILQNLQVEARLQQLSKVSHQKISGGHHFHMATPEVVAEKILQFFATGGKAS